MAIKTRSQLKPYFVKNAIPTEGNFADLIDSALNAAEDGVLDGSLTVNARLKVGAASEVAALTASGLITANGGLKVKGAAVIDGSLTVNGPFTAPGMNGLTLSGDTNVDGVLTASGLRSPYNLVLNDYTTASPSSNVLLLSPPKDRDGWIYRDVTDAKGNSGIYHRQLDTAVKGLPANSLGFIGGSALKAYIDMVNGGAYFAGSLALGATDPGANRLHVQGDARVQGNLAVTGSVAATEGFRASNIAIGVAAFGKLEYPVESIQLPANRNFRLVLGETERLMVGNNGSVSINGSLTIASNAAIKGDLALTGNLGVNGLTVNGPALANKGLTVNGILVADILTTGTITKHRADGTVVATLFG